MKTHKILFEHNGENSTAAYDPICLFANQDITEQRQCHFSAGNDMLVLIDRYQVLGITLPDWLPIEEWIENRFTWHFFWHCYKMPTDLPEAYARKLAYSRIGQNLWGIAKLFKKLRSPFRKSLKAQLAKWLESEANKFDSPFSQNQYKALMRYTDVGRESTNTYYHLQSHECLGINLQEN